MEYTKEQLNELGKTIQRKLSNDTDFESVDLKNNNVTLYFYTRDLKVENFDFDDEDLLDTIKYEVKPIMQKFNYETQYNINCLHQKGYWTLSIN